MRTERLYSLFRKEGKRWIRCDTRAYAKATAVRIFQNQLLAGSFSGDPVSLRPIPSTKPSRIPANQVLCTSCEQHHHDCTGYPCSCGCGIAKG